MKVNADALPRQLRGEARPLYWVSGDETLLTQEATDHIRQFCTSKGFAEREVWHIDAHTDWQAILLSANSLSLFSDRKLLELRLASAKPGERALKALGDYATHTNPDTVVLVSGPKLDAAATRSKGFKTLEPGMLWVQVWPVDRGQLPSWLGRRLQGLGYQADEEALQLLADRVEGNLLAASQEVEKLALLVPPEQRIDSELVARSVSSSARYDVFDLAGCILKGDAQGLLRTLSGLRDEGTDATITLWAVTRELRRLIAVREALDSGRSAEPAMQQQGIWKNQQSAYRATAARSRPEALRKALLQSRSVDDAIKGRALGDPWDQLTDLCLGLCGAPPFP